MNNWNSPNTSPAANGVYRVRIALRGRTGSITFFSKWQDGQWYSTCSTAETAAEQTEPSNDCAEHMIGWLHMEETIPFNEDLVRAALDGQTIQWSNPTMIDPPQWLTFLTPREAIHAIVSFPDRRFRVKPEVLVKWCGISRTNDTGNASGVVVRGHIERPPTNMGYDKVLRLLLDPDTLDVIEAKTEAP